MRLTRQRRSSSSSCTSPLTLIACLLVLSSPASATHQRIQAHAPFDVLVQNLREPAGLARDPATGDLFVAEGETGVILRLQVSQDGSARAATHATGFRRPRGIAWDATQASLLVVDEKAGTLSRIDPQRGVLTLRSDLKDPQSVAVGEDGSIYVTAEEGGGFRLPGREEGVLLRFAPDGSRPELLARGLKRPAGLRVLPDGAVRFLADRLRNEPEREGGTVFEWTPGEDELEVLVRSGFRRPHDLSLDALGATYLTADRQRDWPDRHLEKGVIGKAFSEDGVALFATGLREPQGILFDGQGNLYVVETDGGRVLRFQAPQPPSLNPQPPEFTRESLLLIKGKTDPKAVLTVRGAEVPLPPQTDVTVQVRLRPGSARMHPRTGNLVQDLTLTNTGTTPLAGPLALALTSLLPAEATLVTEKVTEVNGHPAVEVPLIGGLLRPNETVRATLHFRGVRQSRRLTYAHAIWALRPTAVSDAEGNFSLEVKLSPNSKNALEIFATGALGLGLTSAPTKAEVIHDDIPPVPQITSGPPPSLGIPEAAFTFTGTDNFTPADSLQYAWRLDGGEWSVFSSPTSVRLTDLPAGPHVFEVIARDLAGNVSPTPASWAFTVSTLQVTITEPATGTPVPAGPLLVRGTVEAGGAEVGVVVNGLPAVVQGSSFVALVPINLETKNLTAVATTSAGATVSHQVAVTVAVGSQPTLTLHVNPESGEAPLTVTFSLSEAPPDALLALDADGDGTTNFTGTTLDGYKWTYDRPGTYIPTVQLTDSTGTRKVSAVIHAYDRAALDKLLRAKWGALTAALHAGDVEAALALFAESSKAAYRDQFTALVTIGAMGEVAADLASITLVRIHDKAAEYDLRARRNGTEYSFFVLFLIDGSGLWRLWAF